eukprot:g1466.t1
MADAHDSPEPFDRFFKYDLVVLKGLQNADYNNHLSILYRVTPGGMAPSPKSAVRRIGAAPAGDQDVDMEDADRGGAAGGGGVLGAASHARGGERVVAFDGDDAKDFDGSSGDPTSSDDSGGDCPGDGRRGSNSSGGSSGSSSGGDGLLASCGAGQIVGSGGSGGGSKKKTKRTIANSELDLVGGRLAVSPFDGKVIKVQPANVHAMISAAGAVGGRAGGGSSDSVPGSPRLQSDCGARAFTLMLVLRRWGLSNDIAKHVLGEYLTLKTLDMSEVRALSCSSSQSKAHGSDIHNTLPHSPAGPHSWWISAPGSCYGGRGAEWVLYDLAAGAMRRANFVGLRIPKMPQGPLSVKTFHMEASMAPLGPFRQVSDELRTLDTDAWQWFCLAGPVDACYMRIVCTSNVLGPGMPPDAGVDMIGFFEIAFR